jgi:3-deoxy-D-manno-octulosonic-acid transferase
MMPLVAAARQNALLPFCSKMYFGKHRCKRRSMTSPTDMKRGMLLRAYLRASHAIAWIAKPILRKRLQRGKEHPTRWKEKLGHALAPRPGGTLVWLHAVGLGEVLSLRGLIARMSAARPDLSFLVTSSTAASADVFARHAAPHTLHPFLPLDAPSFRKRFLDHFTPDLCIWAEQDLWPGMVSDIAARRIPQAIVAARMNDASFRSHQRAAGIYRDLYQAMASVTSQDESTAKHLRTLGAEVSVTGSLKPAAPALGCDQAELNLLKDKLAGRFIWAAAPAHPEDVAVAQAAHHILLKNDPTALLIIAPRFPAAFADSPLPRRSAKQVPQPSDPIWLCDTLGELGLVYRLSQAVLIGGTFGDVEGHNPWEAAALDNAVLHGPRTANFLADFATLGAANAARVVHDAQAIADALTSAKLADLAKNAKACIKQASQITDTLASDLLALLGADHGR